jgi:uncharacterized membrane protein YozB (DUF420 family)
MEAAAITKSSVDKQWQRDRLFFSAMALAAGITAFVGFAPTYYLKGIYGAPQLPLLVHVHGVLFSSWVVLLIAQSSLVYMRRIDLHRRLGILGAALAAWMTVIGYFTAIGALHRGRMSAGFLAVPLTTVVLFPLLVSAALIARRNPEAHKRLMLIATTELLLAPVGRWPVVQDWGALGSYAVTDIFIAALVAYDLVTRRRPHPVTLWAGFLFIASQPLRQMLGGTATWLTFVHWISN